MFFVKCFKSCMICSIGNAMKNTTAEWGTEKKFVCMRYIIIIAFYVHTLNEIKYKFFFCMMC